MKTLFISKQEARSKLARKTNRAQFNIMASFDMEGTVIAKFWKWNEDNKPRANLKRVTIRGKTYETNWI